MPAEDMEGLCQCNSQYLEIKGIPRRLTLGMPVTQGRGAHVTQPDGSLAAAVDEHIALVWVELSGSDDFCQLLHVSWLDVHNVWITMLRHSA